MVVDKLSKIIENKEEKIEELKLEIEILGDKILNVRNSNLVYNKIMADLTTDDFKDILKAKIGKEIEIKNIKKSEVVENSKTTSVFFEFTIGNEKLYIHVPVLYTKYTKYLNSKDSEKITFGYIEKDFLYRGISTISDIQELSKIIKSKIPNDIGGDL